MENQQNNNTTKKVNDVPKKSNKSPPYALFNLVVIVVAIIYGIYYQSSMKEAEISQTTDSEQAEYKIPMFTVEELSLYDGEGE